MRRGRIGLGILLGLLATAARPALAWQEAGLPLEAPLSTRRLPPVLEEVESDEAFASELLIEKPPRPARGAAGEMRSPLRSSLFWAPAQALQGQPGELSMQGAALDLAAPLWIEEGNLWLATGGVQRLELAGDAVLPDSQLPLPDVLWRVSVGAMHFRDLANGWQTGGIVSIGSASDEPFAGIDDMTATVVGFLNVPRGERDAWNFSLFYSPTSQLPFPIPGIAYVWRPSDELTMKLGIPFSIDYQATETLSLSATYMPLTNVRLRARRQLGESGGVYGGYEVTNDTYWLADRTDEDERLYLFDQRLKVGTDWQLAWGFKLDVSAAYLFDREIFQSDSFTGDRRDEIGVEAGLLGSILLSWSR